MKKGSETSKANKAGMLHPGDASTKDATLHEHHNYDGSACCCSMIDRRQFLTRLGLAGGAALAVNSGASLFASNGGLFDWSVRQVMNPVALPGESGSKPRISVAFSRAEDEYYMGWPGAAFDQKANQSLYTDVMMKAAEKYGIEIDVEHEPLRNTEYSEAFLKKTLESGADGALLVVMSLNEGWPMIHHFLGGRGSLPVIIYSPHGTQFTPRLRNLRDTPNCFLGSTEDVNWLGSALLNLKVVWQLRQTRIAIIEDNRERESVIEPLGVSLVQIPLARFAKAYDATNGSKEAEDIARRFIEKAQEVIEPKRNDIIDAARTYVANRWIMEEANCHAVTMDCLGMVKIKRTPPPCMAYMQLLNERTCGCCERDVFAALSLMLSSYLFGKPGFMHNPAPNTVLNHYAGAHCVAPTLLDGFEGNESNYFLRSHHESDWGVAPQVLLREEQPVTIMKFLDNDLLMAATGKILHNIDTRPGNGIGGCRTSFTMKMDDVADVRDIRGHHNLLVYGNHINELRAWSQLAGVRLEHAAGGVI